MRVDGDVDSEWMAWMAVVGTRPGKVNEQKYSKIFPGGVCVV